MTPVAVYRVVAFVSAGALSLASAVVAVGGALPVNTMVRACDPEARFHGSVQASYELEPLVIQPVVRGPRHRGAIPYRRVASEVAGELDDLQASYRDRKPLRDCYRWARWMKPDLSGDLAMRLRIDEWGRVERVTPGVMLAGGGDAAACFAQALQGMSVGGYTPRRTDLDVTFRLRPSGQTRPSKRPDRPRPGCEGRQMVCVEPRARARDLPDPVCVEQPAVLSLDRAAGPAPVVVVDDFSKEQEHEEKRAKYEAERKALMAAWKAGRRPGPLTPLAPDDDIGTCHMPARQLPRRARIEEAVGFQRGDFEACAAEAAARGAGTRGEVELAALVNRAGQFEAARVRRSTTRDRELDRCAARALEHAHVTVGLYGTFAVGVLLRFVPATARAPSSGDEADAAGDAVDDGDGTQAADRYRAALAAAPASRRCAVSVGVLQAALAVAPWQEDDRVSAAVDGVRDAMRAAPRAPLAACQKLAMPLFAAWVARPLDLGRTTYRLSTAMAAADRIQRLLAFDPPLPAAGLLRMLRADVLLKASLWLEAADQFLAAARAGGLPPAWMHEAANSAAWAYARGLMPDFSVRLRDAISAGPAPEALARHPEIAVKLREALALRRPKPDEPAFPWQVGFYLGWHDATMVRIDALQAPLAGPGVTAMEPRDAWTFLRSLGIGGQPELICDEARRVAAAGHAKTDADRRRLQGFLKPCPPQPE